MSDIIDKLHLRDVTSKQVELCKEYELFRVKSGKAKTDLFILLTEHLSGIRLLSRKNLGVEMALLILMEDNQTAKELYREWQESEAKYKAIERLIDAHQNQVMVEMSIMKYVSQGEKYSQ